MWLGLVAVDVAPSPKAQLRLAIVPSESEDPSEKSHVRPLHETVKLAVGAWFSAGGGGSPPPVKSSV